MPNLNKKRVTMQPITQHKDDCNNSKKSYPDSHHPLSLVMRIRHPFLYHERACPSFSFCTQIPDTTLFAADIGVWTIGISIGCQHKRLSSIGTFSLLSTNEHSFQVIQHFYRLKIRYRIRFSACICFIIFTNYNYLKLNAAGARDNFVVCSFFSVSRFCSVLKLETIYKPKSDTGRPMKRKL